MSTDIRAEHVGSLLRPPELLAARAEQQRGALTAERLRAIEDRAVDDVLALQRDAGIALFTDGELRRDSFMASLVETVDGLVPVDDSPPLGEASPSSPSGGPHAARPRWRRGDGSSPASDVPSLAIAGPLRRTAPQALGEARYLAEHAPGEYKITMVSPSMAVNFWRPGISDALYPTRDDAVAAMAELYRRDIADLLAAGVRRLQLDSLAYAPNLDPAVARQRHITDTGGNMTRTIDTDNRLIAHARAHAGDVTVGMHLCRGNMRSAWFATGGYEPIAERVFGEVAVDRFLLEYDTERAGGFEPLRFVPPGKTVVLGLVSTKVPELESPDELRRRIDAAARYLPLDQLAVGTQCGFASTKHGNLLTVDDQRRKLELLAETAQAVWG